MADFKLFEPGLLKQEGGLSNDTNDTGGLTWEGISENNYPAWTGWPIIKQFIANNYTTHAALEAALYAYTPLQVLVDTFYKCSEWDALNADQIDNQSIANFLVDWEVNAGKGAPIEHAQVILGINPIVINMGPKTLAGINSHSTQDFFNSLQAARRQFYLNVVAAHPSDQKFLAGWLVRNTSFHFTP